MGGLSTPDVNNLWTKSHEGCKTPYKPCGVKGVAFKIQLHECGVGIKMEDELSYVNSSRYESETPLQEAQRKLEELKEQTAATHRQIERLKRQARFGVEPSGGSIIKFEKKYARVGGWDTYTYAALRVGQLWYLTGSGRGVNNPMSWTELKDFIGDGKMWTPRNYEQAPSA